MPKSKRSSSKNVKKYKRKNVKKHKSDNAVICYCPRVSPDVMQVKLSYTENRLITTLVGGTAYVFRGNGCFDPNFTGGGHQPLGYDQWSAFYRRYRVRASKMTVHFYTKDTGEVITAGIVPMTTNTILSNFEDYQEASYSKLTDVGVAGTNMQSKANGLSTYMSTAKIRGAPDDVVQYEIDYSALNTADPNLQWFWHVFFDDKAKAGGALQCDITVKIEYYVDFFDRQTLLQS